MNFCPLGMSKKGAILWRRFCLSCSAWVLSHFSHVQLFATLWTVVCQSPLSMGFSRWEYWRNHLQIKPKFSLSLSPDYRKLLMSSNCSWGQAGERRQGEIVPLPCNWTGISMLVQVVLEYSCTCHLNSLVIHIRPCSWWVAQITWLLGGTWLSVQSYKGLVEIQELFGKKESSYPQSMSRLYPKILLQKTICICHWHFKCHMAIQSAGWYYPSGHHLYQLSSGPHSKIAAFCLFVCLFFGLAVWGILVLCPGMEPMSPAVEAQNPGKWLPGKFQYQLYWVTW